MSKYLAYVQIWFAFSYFLESSGPTGTQANYKERLQSLKRVPVPEAFRGETAFCTGSCICSELFYLFGSIVV